MGEESLEAILVLAYRPHTFAHHEFAQQVGVQGRAEADVEEVGEAAP